MFDTFMVGVVLNGVIIILLILIYLRLKSFTRSHTRIELYQLQKVLEDYSIIAKKLRIEEAIDDLGMFQAPFEDFMRNVEIEIRHLQNWRAEGIEGHDFKVRSSLLKFALNMAVVYARVMGHHSIISKARQYLKKVEEI